MSWCSLSRSAIMRRLIASVFAFVHLCLLSPTTWADESLRSSLGDVELDPIWMYDDWESAQAAAKQSGRPIFVVFR